MTEKNSRMVKFISSLLIIATIAPSILLSKPKQAEAFGATWLTDIFTGANVVPATVSAGQETTQTALKLKDVAKEIVKQIVMTIQRRLLAEMTKGMVNWINRGFHGSPLFLENPKSFFQDIAKYEVKTLIDTFGYDSRRFPFGRDFALNTINSYKRQLGDNAEYTLSRVINDPALLNNYRNDFDFGGWNGFLINTQYQQNNYIGFQLLATEELAGRLQGTVENNAQKVQTTLDQGMGFLSPQTCADNGGNNEYNKIVANQFKRPSFKPVTKFDPTPMLLECVDGGPNPPPYCEAAFQGYQAEVQLYQERLAKERAAWATKNTCKNLVATTPGSVVANQITNAMGSNFRQTELGAALGNSMSAIFDALLNQFLSKGLNALATTKNPPKPPPDDWSYGGLTLGSPTDETNEEWDSGPDEVVILDDFGKQLVGEIVPGNSASSICIMQTGLALPGFTQAACIAAGGIWVPANSVYVPGDIANTQKELALMDNLDPNNPYVNASGAFPPGCTSNLGFNATTGLPCNSGITQIISGTWPKIRELDMCLPGPDFGWKDRLLDEMVRNSKKLQERASDSDGQKAAEADLVLKELKFAVNSFRDWINNKMITELPNSIIYMDAVDEIEDLYQQSEELTDRKRGKTQALIRLQVIKTQLLELKNLLASQNPPLIQPAAGSAEEKTLIALKKQYNAIRTSISSPVSVDEIKNELFFSVDKLARLNSLITQCKTEKSAKPAISEQNVFCEAPIKGGYSHGTFIGPDTTTPKLPMVNAKKVYTWRSWLGLKGNQVNIDLKCDIIYKATLVDYKKDLPGLNSGLTDPLPSTGGTTQFGSCTYEETGMTQDECTASGGSWNISTDICTRTDQNVTEENCTANGGTWEQ